MSYYLGRGVPQDFAQALLWIRPPAAGGVSEAQYVLGVMYAKAEGVPRDDREAFSWLLKSAEQGNALALSFVAADYALGRGTKRDHVEAQKWLNVCAARKSDVQDKCIEGRDALVRAMSTADAAEAQRRADQWFTTCPRPSEPQWNMVCQ
jgi:TPR repeat protein